MKIARVFPRFVKNATPTDELAFVGDPPLWLPEVDKVMVSVTFTWDKPEAERIARNWKLAGYPVEVGGPAYGDPGGEFVPGMFLQHGFTITSRGCPCRCKGCLVPVREGKIRTLPICDGYDVQDNNLLACPVEHIEAVFEMLSRQTKRPRFTGGLEAARFTPEIAQKMIALNPATMFFAYDRKAEREHVLKAVELIKSLTQWNPGTLRTKVQVFVMMGFSMAQGFDYDDTPELASERCRWIASLGAWAYPMFYIPPDGQRAKGIWMDTVNRLMRTGGNEK